MRRLCLRHWCVNSSQTVGFSASTWCRADARSRWGLAAIGGNFGHGGTFLGNISITNKQDFDWPKCNNKAVCVDEAVVVCVASAPVMYQRDPFSHVGNMEDGAICRRVEAAQYTASQSPARRGDGALHVHGSVVLIAPALLGLEVALKQQPMEHSIRLYNWKDSKAGRKENRLEMVRGEKKIHSEKMEEYWTSFVRGATMAERLARSPPTKAGSLGFRKIHTENIAIEIGSIWEAREVLEGFGRAPPTPPPPHREITARSSPQFWPYDTSHCPAGKIPFRQWRVVKRCKVSRCLLTAVHSRRTHQEPETTVQPMETEYIPTTHRRAARDPLHTCPVPSPAELLEGVLVRFRKLLALLALGHSFVAAENVIERRWKPFADEKRPNSGIACIKAPYATGIADLLLFKGHTYLVLLFPSEAEKRRSDKIDNATPFKYGIATTLDGYSDTGDNKARDQRLVAPTRKALNLRAMSPLLSFPDTYVLRNVRVYKQRCTENTPVLLTQATCLLYFGRRVTRLPHPDTCTAGVYLSHQWHCCQRYWKNPGLSKLLTTGPARYFAACSWSRNKKASNHSQALDVDKNQSEDARESGTDLRPRTIYLLSSSAMSFTHASSPIVQPASRTLHCLILAVADFPSAGHFSRRSSSSYRNSATHPFNNCNLEARRFIYTLLVLTWKVRRTQRHLLNFVRTEDTGTLIRGPVTSEAHVHQSALGVLVHVLKLGRDSKSAIAIYIHLAFQQRKPEHRRIGRVRERGDRRMAGHFIRLGEEYRFPVINTAPPPSLALGLRVAGHGLSGEAGRTQEMELRAGEGVMTTKLSLPVAERAAGHSYSAPRVASSPYHEARVTSRRVKRGEYGAALECKGGENEITPRKPADQWNRPARSIHAEIRKDSHTDCCLEYNAGCRIVDFLMHGNGGLQYEINVLRHCLYCGDNSLPYRHLASRKHIGFTGIWYAKSIHRIHDMEPEPSSRYLGMFSKNS
ncbi:hypothetical protein PR048_021045 [Dryococelus australis]|uniref:Uncharacterized protein n=1 Tax=Dryococelus australis TaxID=614101 RepID=A0ABQ9GX39_9NEOP|nr:hypothetical protein PR048_021045 [Dryococelus australis]